jgi:hypothetical protein
MGKRGVGMEREMAMSVGFEKWERKRDFSGNVSVK